MKKNTILIVLLIVSLSTYVNAAEKIVGGGFGSSDASSWTVVNHNYSGWGSPGNFTVSFGDNTPANQPVGGDGESLHITGGGWTFFQGSVFQAVSLVEGTPYSFSLKYRNGGNWKNGLIKVGIATTAPIAGTSQWSTGINNTEFLAGIDAWNSNANVERNGNITSLSNLTDDWNGHLTAKTEYTPSATGIYYFVINFTHMGDSGPDWSFENASLSYVSTKLEQNASKNITAANYSPATKTITVESVADKNRIKVFALTGSIVKDINSTNKRIDINASSLKSGIYVVSVENNTGKTTLKVVVK